MTDALRLEGSESPEALKCTPGAGQAKGRPHMKGRAMTKLERLERMLEKYHEQEEKHQAAGREAEAQQMRIAIVRTQHAIDAMLPLEAPRS